VVPVLKLTSSVSRAVMSCCRRLAALRDSRELYWFEEGDGKRFVELDEAAKHDSLWESVKRDDLTKLSPYCGPGLRAFYLSAKEVSGVSYPTPWKVWAVAMFHDMRFRYKSKGGDLSRAFSGLKVFVERTAHERFVTRLHQVAPEFTLATAKAVLEKRSQKANRLRADKLRKEAKLQAGE
jgi:hypothetical protein